MEKDNERLRSELLASMRGMHQHGTVTAVQLRNFEELCGVVPSYSGNDVKTLRSRLNISQTVLAKIMNASASAIRAWEAGQKRPSGISCKMLSLLDRRGIAALL